MFKDLVKANRSYRGFDESRRVTREELTEMVDCARLSASSVNMQPCLMQELIAGLLQPVLGTSMGAACVFFLRSGLNQKVQKSLLGFASGVMVAASVWSLLIPSMDMSEKMGRFAFVPAVVGLGVGFVFLLAMDKLIPHLHLGETEAEGPQTKLRKTTMLIRRKLRWLAHLRFLSELRSRIFRKVRSSVCRFVVRRAYRG